MGQEEVTTSDADTQLDVGNVMNRALLPFDDLDANEVQELMCSIIFSSNDTSPVARCECLQHAARGLH